MKEQNYCFFCNKLIGFRGGQKYCKVCGRKVEDIRDIYTARISGTKRKYLKVLSKIKILCEDVCISCNQDNPKVCANCEITDIKNICD